MATDPQRAPDETAPVHHLLVRGAMRWALLVLAVASLALGIVGIFVPLLPTVPFVLLAAWAAARSSPRLAGWLENHPRFGIHIRDWQDGGVVRRPAKLAATAVMTASAIVMVFVIRKPWVLVMAIGTMAAVLAWLWRRPESRVERKPGELDGPT